MNNTQALRQRPVIHTPIFAVLLFLFVNVMFFAAFMSSYFVIKRGRTDWIPATIHLPVWTVGFNTLVLLLSGFFMIAATRTNKIHNHLLRSFILGLLFLVFQISSTVQLIRSGLTIQSSVFGGYYFLIIGTHALNAFAGIVAIGWLLHRLAKGVRIEKSIFIALQFFWLFVVGIWPALYAEIYLYS